MRAIGPDSQSTAHRKPQPIPSHDAGYRAVPAACTLGHRRGPPSYSLLSAECLMSIRRAVLCSAMLAALAACSASHFDSSTAQATLLRRDAEWADLAKSGKDLDKIVSYWTDD